MRLLAAALLSAVFCVPLAFSAVSLNDEDAEIACDWKTVLPNLNRLKTHGNASDDGLAAIAKDTADWYRLREAAIADGRIKGVDAWTLHYSSYLYAELMRFGGTRGYETFFGQELLRARVDLASTTPEVRLATALALAFFEGFEKSPGALPLLATEGLVHARPLIRAKTVLALLSGEPWRKADPAAVTLVREAWPTLGADVQDHLMLLTVSHPEMFGTDTHVLLGGLYHMHLQATGNDPSVMRLLRPEQDLRALKEMIVSRPGVLQGLKEQFHARATAVNNNSGNFRFRLPTEPAAMADDEILQDRVHLVTAAFYLYVTSRGAERKTPLFAIAERIVRHEALFEIPGAPIGSTGIHHVEAQKVYLAMRPREHVLAAFEPLLRESDEMLVHAALRLLERDKEVDKVARPHAAPVDALSDLLRSPERLGKLPAAAVRILLGERARALLLWSGLLKDPRVVRNVVARGEAEVDLLPWVLDLLPEVAPALVMEYLRAAPILALYRGLEDHAAEETAKPFSARAWVVERAPQALHQALGVVVFRPDGTVDADAVALLRRWIAQNPPASLAREIRLILALLGDVDSPEQRQALLSAIEEAGPKVAERLNATLGYNPELAQLPGWHLASLAIAMTSNLYSFRALRVATPYVAHGLALPQTDPRYLFSFHLTVYQSALDSGSSGALVYEIPRRLQGDPILAQMAVGQDSPLEKARRQYARLAGPAHERCSAYLLGPELHEEKR